MSMYYGWVSIGICMHEPDYKLHDPLWISHWLKLQHSDWRANLVKDFFLNKFSTNESTRIITGQVILTNSNWKPPWSLIFWPYGFCEQNQIFPTPIFYGNRTSPETDFKGIKFVHSNNTIYILLYMLCWCFMASGIVELARFHL